MEEGKRKRKRSRPKRKKSKSIFAESVGFESQSYKGNIDKTCLVPLPNVKPIVIANKTGDEISTSNDVKNLKRTKSRIKKRRKKMKSEKSANTSLGFSGTGINVCIDEHRSPSNVKLKEDSMVFTQTLSNAVRNTQTDKLSLKEKLQNKLESGRFRWINQKLYTANSLSSFEMFKTQPELFDVYHQGFSSQVQKWPVNPVDTMIDWIKERSPELVIADMGCGEAKISQSVSNKVFSFDFVAVNEFVTVCDMAKVPLGEESVDVVIYCLSLMGINLNDFLQEAFRILKFGGVLKIAEVVSRFDCLSSFEKTVSSFGFKLLSKDRTNKMFIQFEFKKQFKKPDQIKTLPLALKPCLYKRR